MQSADKNCFGLRAPKKLTEGLCHPLATHVHRYTHEKQLENYVLGRGKGRTRRWSEPHGPSLILAFEKLSQTLWYSTGLWESEPQAKLGTAWQSYLKSRAVYLLRKWSHSRLQQGTLSLMGRARKHLNSNNC